jgi:hypothetical protein
METQTMPTYRVNLYNVYLDAFDVDAPSAAEAQQLAHDYEYVMDMPRTGELDTFAGKVAHVTTHAFQYEEDPEVFALTPEGTRIPLGDGEGEADPNPDSDPNPF